MEQRISLITLGVDDLDRARAFYLDGLGWRESSASTEGICFIPLGAVALALYSRTALAEDARVDPRGVGFSGITLAHNTRSRDEVDHVLKQAEAARGRIVKPAKEAFWGGYSGYFSDPDGHLWEVAWNPFFEIDAEGRMALPD